jgi:hypothetical protein
MFNLITSLNATLVVLKLIANVDNYIQAEANLFTYEVIDNQFNFCS